MIEGEKLMDERCEVIRPGFKYNLTDIQAPSVQRSMGARVLG
jgi:hypothetical protein